MYQNIPATQTQIRKTSDPATRSRISRNDRLLRVQIGVAARKSNRQIAKQLGVDEGTVRRDRLTLRLSKEDIRRVKSGAAVEPLLRKHERQQAATARERHEAAERESQFLSNRLAKRIDHWLNQFNMLPVDKIHVVGGIDRWSWEFQTPKRISVPDSQIESTIECVKPKADYLKEAFAVIEFAKEWLFRWIVLVEPDRDIRDRALTKARQELEQQTPYC
ncbi:MAG TPA: hypothetical protein VJW20_00160 [Candidatus Angelobacter sp.]|nr:hypothetical protein [Candidatus Angelobacter sp.]